MFLTALFEGELVSDELLAEMFETGPEGYGLGMASTELWLGSVGSDACSVTTTASPATCR